MSVLPPPPPARGHLPASSPVPAPPPMIRLACQGRRNRFWLAEPQIRANRTGEEVMVLVGRSWKHALADMKIRHLLYGLLWKPVVEIGTLAASRATDPETGSWPREVVFSAFESAPVLNRAFQNPSILRNLETFADDYAYVVRGSAFPRKAVVVRLELYKPAVISLMVGALLVSALAGTIAGILTSNVQSGFACFGAMTATLTVGLGAVYWMIE